MKTNTEGLILREYTSGENNRFVTVLTKELGIVDCYAKGSKSLKGGKSSATQLLSYSALSLYHGMSNYIIDEAESIVSFFNVTSDYDKFCVSQYLCELAIQMVMENTPSARYLELLLNCLHVLTNGSRSPLTVKLVYEIRMMVLSGVMPNIVYCSGCGCYEADTMYFDYYDNKLICSDCTDGSGKLARMSRGALFALRYITLSEPKKIFSFRVSEESLVQLSYCAENYVIAHNGRPCRSLEFCRHIRNT